MGRILSSYIFPHPPIIIPEVGKGNEAKASDTINAVKKAAEIIGKERPDTIIVTTPHGPLFQDYIYISTSDRHSGNMGRFGSSKTRLEFENNLELVESIIEIARSSGIYCGGLENSLARRFGVSSEMDHGAFVPLYFVAKEYDAFRLVRISISGLPLIDQYKFGMCIGQAVEKSNEKVVFIASGDLSHRLSADGPYGYSEDGRKFDELLVKSVRELDVEKLLLIDEDFCESAGECGLRSFIMMFGALDGYSLKPEVFSYEGPFGIGYAVARLEVGEQNPDRKVLDRVMKETARRMEEIRSNESPYVKLARLALETRVKENRTISVPAGLPPEMLENRAGVFVSLKKHGKLRGCIGTTGPTRKNIAEEIIQNAISAGTGDPRFDPVEEDELNDIVYSVDVLKEPEPIKSMDELDVIKYGVIVRSGRRSGLLLPNLEGVNTPEEQVSIALRKAGIRPDENYTMERFEVTRYK